MWRKLIYYWLPLLLWMGMIYLGSNQSKIGISEFLWINFVFFKSLHLLEYALLYLLWFRALYSCNPQKNKINLYLVLAFCVTILYSSTDEFHQLFTPTRSGSLRDIFIDALGMLIMYIGIRKVFPLVKKIL
jgi:VanZ family protein